MKNNLLSIFFCCIIGLSLSYFMFNQYDKDSVKTYIEKETLNFLQIGVYSSKEEMQNNVKNVPYYIYMEENNQFIVFIAITKNENLDKIKGYYESLGYVINVRTFEITNQKFFELLNQYEMMISQIKENSSILNIESQILSKYEEIIKNE
ncbi:MAG: hypothetical protein PHN42_05840 [Bacilli bacterium]|nr:hypothetical protein [Bacilli bacterium]